MVALPDRRFALPIKAFAREDMLRKTTTPATHIYEWHMDATSSAAAHTAHVAEAIAAEDYAEHLTRAHGAESLAKHTGEGVHPPAADLQRASKLIAAAASSGHHLYTFTAESVAQTLALARTRGFAMTLVALEQATNEILFVVQKTTGRCPAHTGFSKPTLPDGCPPRETASGQYATLVRSATTERAAAVHSTEADREAGHSAGRRVIQNNSSAGRRVIQNISSAGRRVIQNISSAGRRMIQNISSTGRRVPQTNTSAGRHGRIIHQLEDRAHISTS